MRLFATLPHSGDQRHDVEDEFQFRDEIWNLFDPLEPHPRGGLIPFSLR